MIDDRFTKGFITGIMAGLVETPFGLISYMLDFGKLRFLDFAAIMIYGYKPENFWEALFAQIGYIMFSSLLGIVFVYLLLLITSANIFLKSWFFAVAVWFFSYAVTLLFQVPELKEITFSSTISNYMSASIWGLALAYFAGKMDSRLKVNNKK
ncbi:MAG: hypothetical protein ACOYVD_03480 [Bacillota bacterium]